MQRDVPSGEVFDLAEYRRIGDDTILETDDFRMAHSGEYMVAGNRYLPTWFEFETDGHNEPNQYCRVEIIDDAPRLVELGWRVRENQSEIQQKHLRDTQVAAIVDVLYAMTVIEVRDGKGVTNLGPEGSEQDEKIREFLYGVRTRRRLTPDDYKRAAQVYRDNFRGTPAQAVADEFGVKLRRAGDIIAECRRLDLLPKTKQGKKKI